MANVSKSGSTPGPKEEIILGAGEVYMYEFEGGAIPEHEEIETKAHNVGHTKGGASVEYAPNIYSVKNSYGRTVLSAVTEEDITFKTGLLSWKLENLAMLSTARVIVDQAAGTKKLAFGGGNALKNVLVRFVHIKSDGKKLRFTMVGQSGSGFTTPFTGEELSIDAEIKAIEAVKGFLAEYEEEIDVVEPVEKRKVGA